MTPSPSTDRDAAIAAGRDLRSILDRHLSLLESGRDQDDAAVDVDSQLWDAIGAYGEALDVLYGDEDEDAADEGVSDELTFSVRARYDYTIVDEKAFLAAGKGVGQAVYDLIHRAGRPFGALETPSLETGSGILTVHFNDELLVASDFDEAEDPTDILLVAPGEKAAYVLAEPVYESRADAEAAAKRDAQ